MWIWSLEEEDTRDYEIKHTGFAGLLVFSAINFKSFVLHYDDIAGMSVLYPAEEKLSQPVLFCSEQELLHLRCPFLFPVSHLELWFLYSLWFKSSLKAGQALSVNFVKI